MKLELTDQNAVYIGDGAYAHIDKYNRLWVVTYNGIEILDKVCIEDDAFEQLVRFYNERVKNTDKELGNVIKEEI
jgi:hypothetical protein